MPLAGLQPALFRVTHHGEKVSAASFLPGFGWPDVAVTEYFGVQVNALQPGTWQASFRHAMDHMTDLWRGEGFRPVGWASVDACDRLYPIMAGLLQRIPR